MCNAFRERRCSCPASVRGCWPKASPRPLFRDTHGLLLLATTATRPCRTQPLGGSCRNAASRIHDVAPAFDNRHERRRNSPSHGRYILPLERRLGLLAEGSHFFSRLQTHHQSIARFVPRIAVGSHQVEYDPGNRRSFWYCSVRMAKIFSCRTGIRLRLQSQASLS